MQKRISANTGDDPGSKLETDRGGLNVVGNKKDFISKNKESAAVRKNKRVIYRDEK